MIWEVLGVRRGASREEIIQAYRKRALELHPDRGGSNAAFVALKDAFDRAIEAEQRSHIFRNRKAQFGLGSGPFILGGGSNACPHC